MSAIARGNIDASQGFNIGMNTLKGGFMIGDTKTANKEGMTVPVKLTSGPVYDAIRQSLIDSGKFSPEMADSKSPITIFVSPKTKTDILDPAGVNSGNLGVSNVHVDCP